MAPYIPVRQGLSGGGSYDARVNQGVDFKKAIPEAEAVARDFPGERFVRIILGQLLNGDGQGEKARVAFERARAIGPRRPRRCSGS